LRDYLKIKRSNNKILLKEEIINFTGDIVCALKYIKDDKKIHRDIKPENMLIFQSKSKSRLYLKLCDFSFAKDGLCFSSTSVGSIRYKPPEIFLNLEYDQKSDLWSLGGIVYEFVYHRTFPGYRNPKKIINPTDLFPLSTDVRDELLEVFGLMKSLLVEEPIDRISYDQLFQVPFIKKAIEKDEKRENKKHKYFNNKNSKDMTEKN